MGSFDQNIETLSGQVDYVKDTRPEKDPSRERVVGAIYEMQAQLQQEHQTPAKWIKIFDTICEYRKVDLTPKQSKLFDSVKRVFRDVIYGSPESVVQTMLQHVEQERAASISSHQKSEVEKVKAEWEEYLLSGKADAGKVKETILERRALMPRLILTLQDEVKLIREVIEGLDRPELKDFEKGLTSELFSVKTALHPGQEIELQVKSVDGEAINALRVRRMHRLMHLKETYEASKGDESNQVASKFFPPTYGWFVGCFQQMPNFSPLEIEMQKIARENQLVVMGDLRLDENSKPVSVTDQNRLDVRVDSTQLMKGISYDAVSPFVQDTVDFSRGGEIRVPRMKHHMEERALSTNISDQLLERRTQRSPEWKKIIVDEKAFPEVEGAVFASQLSVKPLALANSLKCQPVMNLTYNEGGNTLIGQRGSEPYIIVGLDTYAASKDLMEKDLGRSVSDEEVRLALAIDYGVLVENIYLVEQPGDFHLDMSMAIVGEKTILLNDSVMAHEMFKDEQQQWSDEFCRSHPNLASYTREMVRATEKESIARKRMEDVTAAQLEKMGFKVVRVPGKFLYTKQAPVMNLFNMVTAQTPEGKNIAVMMGCVSDKYKNLFTDIMLKHCDRPIDQLHFLDFKASQESLLRFGGIACRTKTIPA